MVLEAGQTQSMVESLLAMTAPKSRATASVTPHVFTCRGGMVSDRTETQELTIGEGAVDILFTPTHATVKAPTQTNENLRKTKKNDIKSLLEPGEATVPKLMGLVVRPPKPKFADDPIGKFDAILAMQLDIFTQEEIEKYNFKGFYPGDGDLSSSSQEHTPKRIQDASTKNAEQPRQEILDCLAKGLGWKEGIKTAATPKRTVEDLEFFYPFLPDISIN
ncbi:hypothetical protein F4859DRAFT_518485 [Xylaria cf. heliscus]|nr:hypothetical protein F4859DRAFT_518485 [Xylaria cf. heliscus]